MLVEIKYKDKINWESISGIAIDFSNYFQKFKAERVQASFLAPEEILDTWNGIEHIVQHAQYDTYYLEFYIQESELFDISKLKSCSDIQIIQYSDNQGTEVEKTYTLNTQKSDYIDIQEPERVAFTSSYKVIFKFRTNKTIINKSLPVDNLNTIRLNGQEYNTDFKLLEWAKLTENINISWADGGIRLGQTVNKVGFEILLYLDIREYDGFVTNFNASQAIEIKDGVNWIDYYEQTYEPSIIAEGIYKVIIRCVGTPNVTTFDLAPLQTNNLSIGTSDYYTDYPVELISENPELNSTENQTGVSTLVKGISKGVKQAKFYLSEANAFQLKKEFETGTDVITLNSETVLESREITPVRLGKNFYEVVVNCLTETFIT